MSSATSSSVSPPALSVVPAQERRWLYVLASMQFTHIVDFMIMMPLGPLLSRDMGLATHEFGLLVSSYTFAAAATGVLCALFVDRFERKHLLLKLYVLFAFATLACALAPNFWGLLCARALAGAFGGVMGALITTVVGDLVPPERRGRAMGLIAGSFAFATVAGVPLSLWLANHTPFLGWRAAFVAVGLVALLIACVAQVQLPAAINVVHKSSGWISGAWQRMRDTLLDPVHRWSMAFGALVMFSSFSVIPYLTIYATQNVGFPVVWLPVMYLIGGICTLVSSPWIGRQTDRWGKLKSFQLFALLALLPLLTATHIGPVPVALYLLVTTAFFVLVSGRWIPAQALIAGVAQPQLRGTFMSLSVSIQQAAMATATLTSGHLLSNDVAGHLVGFERTGYVAVVATALALWVAPRLRQRA